MVGSGVYIGLSRAHNRPIFLGAKRNQRNKSIIYNRHSPAILNIINRYGVYNYSAMINTIIYHEIVYLALILIYFPLQLCLCTCSPNRRHHNYTPAHRANTRNGASWNPGYTSLNNKGPYHNNNHTGRPYGEPFSTPGKNLRFK